MRRTILLFACLVLVAWIAYAGQQGGAPDGKKVDPAAKPLFAIGAIQPRLSPDGSTIACAYQGAIWTVRRGGGVLTCLTDGEGFDMEPAWSPDGQRLALVRTPYGSGGDIKIIQAKDGMDLPLPKPVQARGNFTFQKLHWHPDGKKILGGFRVGGKDVGLAWFDVDSGAATTVMPAPSAWSRYALSPDGQWIVYTESLDKPGQQTGNDGVAADLWKIPAQGGKAEKVARFPSRIHDLCFDADGKSLIVVGDLGSAYYDLWQVPLEDSLKGMKKLTQGQADEDRPSLSKDGRWLAYTDNRDGSTTLMVRDQNIGQDSAVPIQGLDYRRPTGSLRLAMRDRDTKQPVVGRVSLVQEGGKHHAPPGALYRVLKNYGHFYCPHASAWTLPAGKYRLRVYRGPEYKVAVHSFEVAAGKTRELTVDLERWTHQAKKGWHSGENHIHANYGYGQWFNSPRTMLEQCAGEDLNVCNLVVANSDTDNVFDRAFFRGGPDPLSTRETILYWNQEFRATLWGHMTLLNLKQVVEPVFTGFQGTTNPWDVPTNADVAERTHWQQGVVNYTHVAQNADDPFQNPYAAKALPVDVALGRIDTLDINNSYQGCVPIWHRLLNCGFRVPATAGTDCFLNRIFSQLPGGDRVYVQVKGPLNYADWIANMKAGRSFVTSGPMLDLTIDSLGLGEDIKLLVPKKALVKARAASAFPLGKVELIYNGKVAATLKTSADDLTAEFHDEVLLDKSGWLALRANAPGTPDSAKPLLYAHTNPIYVEVGGNPVRSAADARFFLDWIDQLSLAQRARNRVPNDEQRRHVQEQIEKARGVFEKMLKTP